MKRFIEGEDRKQATLLPECLDDFITEDNPVRIVEAFVEELELGPLGFDGATRSVTGRPSHNPSVLLKIYIHGYLNRGQSSRRLGRECQRNVELMWLTGRLVPDFKTIADFRRDNGEAIRNVCRLFVMLCRRLDLFAQSGRSHRWQQIQSGQRARSQFHLQQAGQANWADVVVWRCNNRRHRHSHVSLRPS